MPAIKDLLPDKFHLVVRAARSKCKWLKPTKALAYDEALFQDAMREDISSISEETLDSILANDKDPHWLRRIALAEKMIRQGYYVRFNYNG